MRRGATAHQTCPRCELTQLTPEPPANRDPALSRKLLRKESELTRSSPQGQREEKASRVKPAHSRLWSQGGVSGQRRAQWSFPSWVLLMTADDLQGCSLFSSGKRVISYFPRISRKFQNKNKRREENRRSKSTTEETGKTSEKWNLEFWEVAGYKTNTQQPVMFVLFWFLHFSIITRSITVATKNVNMRELI